MAEIPRQNRGECDVVRENARPGRMMQLSTNGRYRTRTCDLTGVILPAPGPKIVNHSKNRGCVLQISHRIASLHILCALRNAQPPSAGHQNSERVGHGLVRTLVEGSFLDRRENVLAFGKPNSGKTHLLCGVGQELVRAGRTVCFSSTELLKGRKLANYSPDEVEELHEAVAVATVDVRTHQQLLRSFVKASKTLDMIASA
jgi:hypothetical protein